MARDTSLACATADHARRLDPVGADEFSQARESSIGYGSATQKASAQGQESEGT
jgi:hypothetical protein